MPKKAERRGDNFAPVAERKRGGLICAYAEAGNETAFRFALIGMCFGAILGLLGLAVTRWENQREGLFYTPSRWLALLVTLAIAARFVYDCGTPRTPAAALPASNIG